ncbi:hypothetical protein BDN70DRAFT_878249 [Pholiota conissans]|uniref:GST N-terminal domain-containing protein n=1 Tax=Pholiota conissans TaxID=109636 RepID=A0A9P6D131_9AGAR|nr:hypothetical protein BDN70DRAFT_878249 [Pholiota conissans]
MTIIFYDIPSTIGPWSPNTWKVRYCLNFKGLPYKTEWIEYPDIAPRCQQLGIAHTTMKPDGVTPHYTLPAIYDPSTKRYIAESAAIAEYLEEQYPDTPAVFPFDTMGLLIDFKDALNRVGIIAAHQFVRPAIHRILNPASQGFYRTTREQFYGKKLEDVAPKLDTEEGRVEWAKIEATFATVALWYSKNGGKGPFILGDRVSWADFVVGGNLLWFKAAWGEDDKKWKDLMSWQGGVWKTLSDALKEYEKQLD